MRILPVSQEWPKLHLELPTEARPWWTTFRLRRQDKDWELGEVVQVVLHPRSKQRKILGIAKIINKEPRYLCPLSYQENTLSLAEAIEDGFQNLPEMKLWMIKAHGHRIEAEPLNKLTLEWIEQYDNK